MSVHGPILWRLALGAGRVAIVDDRRSWTGFDLIWGALALAREIERTSSAPTVGLLIPTSGAFAMAALAGWMAGRTIVPLNYLLKPEELQYVVNDCETDLLIASRALVEHMGAAPTGPRITYLEDLNFRTFRGIPAGIARAFDDTDLACLLYTSGTSGKPKGVMLTHGNLVSNIRQARDLARLTPRDVFLGVLPQFHSFGFTVLTLLPLTLGARVVYTARFVPRRLIELIRDQHATVMVAIPSMYAAMLGVKNAERESFSSLRFAVSGGEPLPEAVLNGMLDRFGVLINEGYGLTETSPLTNVCLPDEFKPRCVGRSVAGLEELIVDPATGRTLDIGEEGEIRMRGPNVMKGYFKLPKESGEAFDASGFFRSGDIGTFDDQGRLSITGRLKEMLIVGGENVFPREIEEVLNHHPAVKGTGVVGQRDDVRGEIPIAFVELEDGAIATDVELREWCRDKIAGYKVPREVRILPALPRNPTGKIVRKELAKLVNSGA